MLDKSIKWNLAYRALTDLKKNFLYFPIHKNAHSKLRSTFFSAGWEEIQKISPSDIIDEKLFNTNVNKFAVIRDPYERWISGFCSFIEFEDEPAFDKPISTLIKSDHFDEILTVLFRDRDDYEFDIHCKLQVNFIKKYTETFKCSISDITFFYLNNNLGYQINKWLQSHNELINVNNHKTNVQNKSLNSYRHITEFLFNAKNEIYKQKLYAYLKPDYDFIDSLNFYAR